MGTEWGDAKIAGAYLEHRPYLIDMAFRMLGDIGAAEDAVQDAYTRLLAAGASEIADARGWLIVVTSRLCLDRIKSARSRRESARDAIQIEFTGPPVPPPLADPADRVTFDDSVSLALLVVLQQLTPAERVAFILHDIFQMPFGAVVQATGRAAPACRQLAVRARQKIAASEGARFEVASAEHRLVTEKFIGACAAGDLSGLLAVLAPDAWGDVDYGPGAARPHVVVNGAERVARHLLHYWGPGATLVSHPAGRQPAVLGFRGRELAVVLVFTVHGEAIQTVHAIADPTKLGFLRLQLAAPA
jgi:RNA polymerase sigma-70 factor, ECF subfamily